MCNDGCLVGMAQTHQETVENKPENLTFPKQLTANYLQF